MKKKIFTHFSPANFNITILLVLLLCNSHGIYSQTHKLNIIVKLKVIQGDLKNSLVTITKKGVAYKVIDPSVDKNNVELPVGSEYLLTFTKIGYITKTVFVDTHVPQGREESEFANKIAEVELEKQEEEQVIYSKPVAKIAYSAQKDDFSYEKDHNVHAEKQKKEKDNPLASTKTNQSTLAQNNSASAEVKPTAFKPESTPQKPIAKNKVVRVIQEDYKKITIITINVDERDYVYRKEELNFTTFFYKDGKNITSDTYENETK